MKRMEKMENKDEENIRLKELEEIVYNFFNDLRFNDGTKVEERLLEVSSDGSANENDQSGEESDPDLKSIMLDQNLEKEKETKMHQNNEEDHKKSRNVDPNQIEEIDEEKEDDGSNEYEKKRLMYLDLENKRTQYIKDLKRLGLKDDEIAELLNQYDEKMHRMKEMMEGDAELQEEKLKKRLDKKKKGKDAGKQKIMKYNNQQRAVRDKYKDQIEEIEGRIMQKSDDVDDALVNEKDQGEKEIEKKI